MASEVTDEELTQKMRQLIKDCDLSQTTTKTIRKQLERELGCDLKARKKEITQIMQSIIIETQEESEEHSAEEDEEMDSESALPALTLIELPNAGSRGRAPKKPSTSSIQLSEELMNFLGTDDAGMPRKEVLARIRQYMKDQGLPKDPRDGRKTVLDLPLQQLFKVKTVTAININKYLSKHMKRWMNETVEEEADSYDDVIESPPAKKSPKKTKAPQKKTATKRKRKSTGGDDDDSEEKKKKKKPGGFAKVQYHLSPELAAVVGAKTMARPQIVKQLWVYIKANKLQKNPDNQKEIFCDDLLEKALGQKKVTMFTMNKFVGIGILDKV